MSGFQAKKNKTTQYIIGAVVAVIIFGLWMTIPLMSGSSTDSSVSANNPFGSKVADISALGSDISSEGGAPGSPLSGEMINNPATSGEEMASSLFQSGAADEELAASTSSASSIVSSPGESASPFGAPSASAGSLPKLSASPSMGGGGGGSMTSGATHSNFFGAGNKKAEFASATGLDLGKKAPAAGEKGAAMLAMLNNSVDKSKAAANAAKAGNLSGASNGASGAFTNNTAKPDLDTGLEKDAAASGLELGQTAQDLKKSDPSLNKKNIKVPDPSTAKDVASEDAEMKKLIIQMIFQSIIGPMFSSIFSTAGSGTTTTTTVTHK